MAIKLKTTDKARGFLLLTETTLESKVREVKLNADPNDRYNQVIFYLAKLIITAPTDIRMAPKTIIKFTFSLRMTAAKIADKNA